MKVTVGDIGGTNTRLSIVDIENNCYKIIIDQSFKNRKFSKFEDVLQTFLEQHKSIAANIISLGVAGPIRDGICLLTNLSWTIDQKKLQNTFCCPVWLLNDLEANAYGIFVLRDAEIKSLNPQAKKLPGNAAILSAGTGLGEAGLYWDGKTYHPFATEGGHTDFAASDELEIELLRYLLAKQKHVSWEHLVSGIGIYNIYCFLRDSNKYQENHRTKELIQQQEPARIITETALANECPLCRQTLDMFVKFYGAEAGNIGLKFMATSGIYIGGGIAPKILSELQKPIFWEAFCNKGRMRTLLEQFPVYVILNEKTALLGAARYAFLKATS